MSRLRPRCSPQLLALTLLVAGSAEAQLRPPFGTVLGGTALGSSIAAGITTGITAACVASSTGWDEMGCILLPFFGVIALPVASATGAKWAIRRSGFTPGRYAILHSYGALMVGLGAGIVTYSAIHNSSREYWGTGVGFLTHLVLTSFLAHGRAQPTEAAGAGYDLFVRADPLRQRLEIVATFRSGREFLALVTAPRDL